MNDFFPVVVILIILIVLVMALFHYRNSAIEEHFEKNGYKDYECITSKYESFCSAEKDGVRLSFVCNSSGCIQMN